jgi:hypothetical protein
MVIASDPTPAEPDGAGRREWTFAEWREPAERREPDEPRFASPVPSGYVQPPVNPPPSPGSAAPPGSAPPLPGSAAPLPGSAWPGGGQQLIGYAPPVQPGIVLDRLGQSGPVVDYGPAPEQPPAPRSRLLVSWAPPVLAAAGGLLAGVASLLTWVTLRVSAGGADSVRLSDGSTSITYNGLSLLEGRVMLVLGVAALAFSVLLAARRQRARLLTAALAVTGALGTVVMLFAAIGHPVDLATLLRSNRQVDGVTVSLPGGVGLWLAIGGAVLIAVGGLLGMASERAAKAELERAAANG